MSQETAISRDDEPIFLFGDGDRLPPEILLQRLDRYQLLKGLEQDNFSLGGTVQVLEEKMASILGKESAIFMPTGTLANHLALRHLCFRQERVIVPEQSHIYNDTGDSLEKLSGIKLIPLGKNKPIFSLREVRNAVTISRNGRVGNPIGALVIESPVRRQLGKVMPYAEMTAITNYCRRQNIASHLDGARIFMMSAATGIPVPSYAALFDTVYVSLYKYLNAPSGAILAGPSNLISKMVDTRRMFGGALWGAYLFAALAIAELDKFEEKFAEAFRKFKELIISINELEHIHISSIENGSNIFQMDISERIEHQQFYDALARKGIHIGIRNSNSNLQTVTANTSILRRSNKQILEEFSDAIDSSIVRKTIL